jgi:hypothetical protein
LPVSFISLRLERVDNLGAYRIPPETGILIPSDFVNDGETTGFPPLPAYWTCVTVQCDSIDTTTPFGVILVGKIPA